MIQFNLLPDIKLEYIRARRAKRLVMLVSFLVAGASVAICLVLFFTVNILQKQHLNNLSKDINRDSKKLQEIEDLDKILTIQNQLSKLTELHDGKVITSRLNGYVTQVTPQNVSYAEIEVEISDTTMRFKGSADSLKSINQFVDTLKFTKYKIDGQDEKNAFSEVVLADFGRDDKGASYEIKLKYDPEIFNSQNKLNQLIVPNIITTRSVTEKPSAGLFVPLSDSSAEEEE